MKSSFYAKLALLDLRKNKQLTLPYILAGSMMVMMYYILSFLSESPAILKMRGGSIMQSILPMGCGMIAVFSVLFLFYTHSFLFKQQFREFGLYNVLGMDKRNISKIVILESVFIAAIAIGIGLAMGILFSKIAELMLLNLLDLEISFDFHLGFTSLYQTPIIFGGIYLLLLLDTLIRLRRFRPLELMQHNRVGEKIPKLTWPLATLGVLSLGTAYYLAVSIKEPLTALATFFIAVILVILGTYLLFIAGSVTFCRLLQKNKRYYYKPNHFVSVASMVYRMKRNGAGLASICILLTMVLVMISSTASLYFGAEESINNQCSYGVFIEMNFDDITKLEEENLALIREVIAPYSNGADLTGIRTAEIPGLFTEKGILIDVENAGNFTNFSYDNIGYLIVLSLADYNRNTGQHITLAGDECLLYTEQIKTKWDSFTMEFCDTYKVKQLLKTSPIDRKSDSMVVPTVCLVVSNPESFFAPIRDMLNPTDEPMVVYDWTVGFDLDTPEEELNAERAVYENLNAFMQSYTGGAYKFSMDSQEERRIDFYDTYGSLFFLGIMLSIVFLLAAVLIIYYKQISEGFEDHNSFAILQKVGMTKKDIRKSIDSQMLTVFFLPLIVAGIHLFFAFPFIVKIFRLFSFFNIGLSIFVHLSCFILFGLFYALVYRLTSKTYYDIVSSKKE